MSKHDDGIVVQLISDGLGLFVGVGIGIGVILTLIVVALIYGLGLLFGAW